MTRVQLLVLAFILSACSRDTPETGASGAASSSPYTADSKDRAREDGLEGTNSGSELEAPRLIPAVRNQLDLMSSGSPTTTENVTAYKNLASDLVTSMQADLYRVGFADSGQFRALSDSVLDDLDGGSGTAATGPEPSQVKEHVTRMRRLLDLYQQTMKGAANKL
ncbi:MAG TPA: hypothetical protein VGP44_11340 [Gemmatimonadales bacterium]|nr:hypothetical protein [Gemmatimonadales bacterium]